MWKAAVISPYRHGKGQIPFILSCTLDSMGYYVSIKKEQYSIFSDGHRNIQSLEFSGSGCKASIQCPALMVLAKKLTKCHGQQRWQCSLWTPFVVCSCLCRLLCFPVLMLIYWFPFFCPRKSGFVFSLNQAVYLFCLQSRTLTVRRLRDIINRMGDEKTFVQIKSEHCLE